MAYSMTGFGACTANFRGVSVEVQVKTLNSRGLDLHVNMDTSDGTVELLFSKLVKQYIARGRVELTVLLKRSDVSKTGLNHELLERRVKSVESLFDGEWSRKRCIEFCINQEDVWRDSTLVSMDSNLSRVIMETAQTAIEHAISVRRSEGKVLKEYLLNTLESLETSRQSALSRAPLRVSEFRQRLAERIEAIQRESGAVFERKQMEGEVALLSEKMDISEELTRMGAHISALRILVLTKADPLSCVGKKYDFYLQELSREATAIASKSRDAQLTRHTIDMRTSIEAMREQVANLQ